MGVDGDGGDVMLVDGGVGAWMSGCGWVGGSGGGGGGGGGDGGGDDDGDDVCGME